MPTELITVYGETDNTNATGVFTLKGQLFTNSVNYIRLDKGLKAKIWAKRVAGAPLVLKVEVTDDVTVDNPSWRVIDAEFLTSPGNIDLEKRHPIIVEFKTGKEAFRFSWDQSATGVGKSYVSFDIEIEEV